MKYENQSNYHLYQLSIYTIYILNVMVPVSPPLAQSQAICFFYCFLPLSLPLSLSLLSLAWLGGTHYGLPPLGHAPGLINHLPLVNLVFLAIT